jgi:hypothetical protein
MSEAFPSDLLICALCRGRGYRMAEGVREPCGACLGTGTRAVTLSGYPTCHCGRAPRGMCGSCCTGCGTAAPGAAAAAEGPDGLTA